MLVAVMLPAAHMTVDTATAVALSSTGMALADAAPVPSPCYQQSVATGERKGGGSQNRKSPQDLP